MKPVAACIIAYGLCAMAAFSQLLLPSPGPQPQSVQPQAQPMLPQTAQAQAQPKPPIGQMYAIHASGAVPQNVHIDDKLKSIAPMLNDLPYTSYEAIAVNDHELPWGVETLFPISAVHAFHVTALSQNQEGAIALRARVEMLQGEDYINALDTQAVAARNQALLFRGIPLGHDELVIVLLVGMPPEPGEDGSPNQEGESEPEGENQDSAKADSGDNTEGEGEQEPEDAAESQESQTDETVEGEGEPPKGVENLDALLESLDDIDRREQVEELKQRDRIDFKGDWW